MGSLSNSLKELSPQTKILISFFGPFFIGLLSYVLLTYLNYNSKNSIDFSKSNIYCLGNDTSFKVCGLYFSIHRESNN